MPHARVALLAVTLLAAAASGAGAQMILQGPAQGPGPGPAPTTGPVFGPGTATAPPPPQQQQQSGPPCMAEFLPLREEAEKRAAVLRTAIDKKTARPELCQMFRRFSEAEEKVVKYASSHQVACNVPAHAIAEMKKNHAKTAQVREKVCAPEPVAKPAGPNLGEVLGTRSLPTPETMRPGGGTFDTLTGNPLAR
jgi:hypothetical protein